jgi:hypothetical protein
MDGLATAAVRNLCMADLSGETMPTWPGTRAADANAPVSGLLAVAIHGAARPPPHAQTAVSHGDPDLSPTERYIP